MIARIKAYLGLEPLTTQQIAVGAGSGAMAQLMLIWQATSESIIQLPFFVLTIISMLNWLTGGLNALVDGRFSVRGFYKGPLRWCSYIILAVVIANMGLLVQQMPGVDDNYAIGVIFGLWVIAATKEADSVIENIDLPPMIRDAWSHFSAKARGPRT